MEKNHIIFIKKTAHYLIPRIHFRATELTDTMFNDIIIGAEISIESVFENNHKEVILF